ncbi:hypothetical protein [Anaerotruncus colihominis]|uniref:hypothetical protein n=1 Tax=Anaerotruncus colihominis TaxID=169435 RepID=UPI001FACD594|nr:hypothetical protein [Anaerotruncus colihominis]
MLRPAPTGRNTATAVTNASHKLSFAETAVRCSEESTGLKCHARTINKLILEDAVVKAVNQMLGDKNNYQT